MSYYTDVLKMYSEIGIDTPKLFVRHSDGAIILAADRKVVKEFDREVEIIIIDARNVMWGDLPSGPSVVPADSSTPYDKLCSNYLVYLPTEHILAELHAMTKMCRNIGMSVKKSGFPIRGTLISTHFEDRGFSWYIPVFWPNREQPIDMRFLNLPPIIWQS